MAKNILTRVLQTLVVLIGVAFLIFVMLRIVPGNAVTTMMGEHVNAEAVERMTRELGLDQPVPVQFWRYLTGALRGDFGTSYSLNRSVSELIAAAFPNTVRLALAAATGGVGGRHPVRDYRGRKEKRPARSSFHGLFSAGRIDARFHGGDGAAIPAGVQAQARSPFPAFPRGRAMSCPLSRWAGTARAASRG